MEYLIRQARITDVDRLAAIGRGTMPGTGSGSLDAADLLRQLVYLPNASLLVAEMRREIVGGALLVLRPSVTAGGYVGTVDFLVVAPDHDSDRVTDALIEEVLRSAGNKGCSTVEAAVPSDPASLARLQRAGFAPAGPTLRRPLLAAGPTAARGRTRGRWRGTGRRCWPRSGRTAGGSAGCPPSGPALSRNSAEIVPGKYRCGRAERAPTGEPGALEAGSQTGMNPAVRYDGNRVQEHPTKARPMPGRSRFAQRPGQDQAGTRP